jgi:hypothetical protein
MPRRPRPTRSRSILSPAFSAAIVLALSAVCAPVRAQEQPPPQLSVEQLTAYAKAYIALTVVHEEFAAQLADARNKTAEAQETLRRSLEERVARVIQEHGMTATEHRRITYIISVDAEQRAAFERIRTDIEAQTKTGGGG